MSFVKLRRTLVGRAVENGSDKRAAKHEEQHDGCEWLFDMACIPQCREMKPPAKDGGLQSNSANQPILFFGLIHDEPLSGKCPHRWVRVVLYAYRVLRGGAIDIAFFVKIAHAAAYSIMT